MTAAPIVFLVDVDNTLLDNDRIQGDLKRHLEREFGAATRDRYWAILEAFFADTSYRGCPYIIFTAELTDRNHPARKLIERRLVKRRAWFRDRAAEAGLPHPDDVAEELDLLFDGALALGAKRGDLSAVRTARRMAERITAPALFRVAVA